MDALVTVEIRFDDEWVDVSCDVESGTIRRGRRRELDRYETGSLDLTLSNLDRQYDPTYTAGPYYGFIEPMRAVRVTCQPRTPTVTDEDATYGFHELGGYGLPTQVDDWILGQARREFVGLIDEWALDYGNGLDATVAVSCFDYFGVLAAVDLSETDQVGEGEKPAERIERILTAAGVDVDTDTDLLGIDLDDGVTLLQAYEGGDNALAALQLVERTEAGALFISRGGVLRFVGRHNLLLEDVYATAQIDFVQDESDPDSDPPQIWYEGAPEIVNSRDLMANRVSITPVGGFEEVAVDEDSAARYQPAVYSDTQMIMLHQPEAESRAEWILRQYHLPELFVARIAVGAHHDETVLDAVLQIDLHHRVRVTFQPPGGGDPMVQDLFVEQLEHQFTAWSWTTALSTASAERYGEFTPDDWFVLDTSELDVGVLAP